LLASAAACRRWAAVGGAVLQRRARLAGRGGGEGGSSGADGLRYGVGGWGWEDISRESGACCRRLPAPVEKPP
jgi:hypothetical protein